MRFFESLVLLQSGWRRSDFITYCGEAVVVSCPGGIAVGQLEGEVFPRSRYLPIRPLSLQRSSVDIPF